MTKPLFISIEQHRFQKSTIKIIIYENDIIRKYEIYSSDGFIVESSEVCNDEKQTETKINKYYEDFF